MRRPVLAVLTALAVGLAAAGCTASPAPPPSSAPATRSAPAPGPVPTGPRTTIGVLGDSLSRGYNACSHFGDCPEVSWAGGTDPRIDSVATRIGDALGGPVTVRNAARSGARARDLAAQLPAVIAARPQLVTLLIGANDVCRASLDEMTPTADYAAEVSSILQELTRQLPDAVVLVASVPDVTAILPAAASDSTARFLWSHGGCATVLKDPLSRTSEAAGRRADVADRIREYDGVLAGACGVLPRCVFDGGALHGYTPTLRQLSALDRFHPSVAGLQELAKLEWSALSRSDRAASLLGRAS